MMVHDYRHVLYFIAFMLLLLVIMAAVRTRILLDL